MRVFCLSWSILNSQAIVNSLGADRLAISSRNDLGGRPGRFSPGYPLHVDWNRARISWSQQADHQLLEPARWPHWSRTWTFNCKRNFYFGDKKRAAWENATLAFKNCIYHDFFLDFLLLFLNFLYFTHFIRMLSLQFI